MIRILIRFFSSLRAGKRSEAISEAWRELCSRPHGKLIFAWLICFMSPFNLFIFARVEEMIPDYCEARMRIRWWKKNPFGTGHAIALAGLAEVAANAAFFAYVPDHMKIAVVGHGAGTYHKWARGMVTAVAKPDMCSTFIFNTDHVYETFVEIKDEAGSLVYTTSFQMRVWSKDRVKTVA